MNSCLNTFKIFYVNKFADHHLFANLSWEYHGMSFCNFSSFYRQVVDNRSKDPEQAPKMCAVWKTGTRWTVQKMASMWITAKWGPPSLSVSGSELIYEYHWISAQGYTSFWCQKKKTCALLKPWIPSTSGSELMSMQSYQASPFCHDNVAWMCSQCIP